MTTTPPPMPVPVQRLNLGGFAYSDDQMQARDAQWQQIIERKDALLRQALDAMTAYASTHGSVAAVRDARDSSIEAIRKELQ